MAGARSSTTPEPAHAVAWHDDAPDPTQFTTPSGTPLPAQVDWLIVGGGYAGLSAARRAAERGARVLLVDKGVMRETQLRALLSGDAERFYREETSARQRAGLEKCIRLGGRQALETRAHERI